MEANWPAEAEEAEARYDSVAAGGRDTAECPQVTEAENCSVIHQQLCTSVCPARPVPVLPACVTRAKPEDVEVSYVYIYSLTSLVCRWTVPVSVTINYSVSSSTSSLTNLLVSSPAETFSFGPLPASPSPATQQLASRQHVVTASPPLPLPLGHVDTADSAGTRGEGL